MEAAASLILRRLLPSPATADSQFYSASKASLIGFTRSLAREVGKLGITVNAVAPGFVDTEMTRGMKDEQREQIVRRSALKRLVDVEDVVNAVEFRSVWCEEHNRHRSYGGCG